MTPAAVLDRHRASERLPLWTDELPARSTARSAAVDPEASSGRRGAGLLVDAVGMACSELEAGFATSCLLCGGAMRPRWSAGAGVVGGRCVDCGTDLE